MKRMVIFIIIGLLLFAAGIGGGMFFTRYFKNAADDGPGNVKIAVPGPIISVGEFTVNLAGAGNRILNFSVSVETLNAKADALIKNQNWTPRIKHEINLLAKDRVFEDLTKSEGVIQFGEQIKRTLNTILPQINGEVLIVRVMFESFILQ